MDPFQKTYFRQSWTQWWKSLILIIQWEWKGTLRRILAADRRDGKHYMQKKKNERKKYIMGYEYALLEEQKNRHTNCSRGRDHNADYIWANGKERWSNDPAALLPTTWCQLQEASLFSVSCWLRREIKEDAVHHPGQREDDGRARILFLRPDEIWCIT